MEDRKIVVIREFILHFPIQVSKLRGCDLHREVMNIPFDFYYGTCGVFNLGIDVALLCFYYNDWKGCWR